MIVIEILNVEQVVERHRGALAALSGSLGVNLEGRVEAAIIEKIKQAFEENGIEARLHSVGRVRLTVETDI